MSLNISLIVNVIFKFCVLMLQRRHCLHRAACCCVLCQYLCFIIKIKTEKCIGYSSQDGGGNGLGLGSPGTAADRGGGGKLLLPTLPPFIARAHTCLEGQPWTVACLIPLHWLFCLSLHRQPSKYFCFWAFYAHFRLKTNVFLQFISKKLFCRHQHQPYFLLLLFQLSHIKTKQQTPLTLIDICIATRGVSRLSAVSCYHGPLSSFIVEHRAARTLINCTFCIFLSHYLFTCLLLRCTKELHSKKHSIFNAAARQ